MINRWFGRTLRHCLALMATLSLAACGGGGGDEGGFLGPPAGQTPSDIYTLAVTMVDADGNTLSTVDANTNGTILVTVTNTANGTPVPDVVVNAGLGDVGTLQPASLSALTDANGVARFTLSSNGVDGAGSITFSVDTTAGPVQANLNFRVDAAKLLAANLQDQSGNTITLVDPLTQGFFSVRVSDGSGDPLVGEVVTTTTTVGRLLPSNGTALTNASGVALFIVQPDGEDGAGTLTASVPAGAGEVTLNTNFQVSTALPFVLTAELRDANDALVATPETSSVVTLRVVVTDDRTGEPVPFQVVSADAGELGSLIPDSGTTLTDENGVAEFELTLGTATGAFEILTGAIVPGGSVTLALPVNVVQAERKLGYFDVNGDFVEGQILIAPDKQLSPTGTAALTVAVVDGNDQRATSQEVVTLTSECLFGGQAVLDPAGPISFTAQTTASYTVSGCTGSDVVTATLGSTGATATGTVDIAALSPEVIRFSEATPAIIALRDTGNASNLTETAQVTFTVTDRDGNPVSNTRVNFALSTTIGGAAMSCSDSAFCSYPNAADAALNRSTTATDRSDFDGVVSVEVLSGFVATPVRVTAYIDLDEDGVRDDNEPQTTSTALVMTTGLPDQDSVSLSASVLNVLGAYDTDGTTSQINLRMADKFNNPVPDGTQAVFTTEYGVIQGSCTTADGVCSVTWSSQSPRNSAFADPIRIFNDPRYDCPAHNEPGGPCPLDIADPEVNPPGAPRGGRTTILATAIGEESFVDRNGNGLYDQGEFWTNLLEAFRDENEDGVHTPSQRANCGNPATADDICLAGFDEDFIDFNENGVYDLNDLPAAAPGSSLPSGLYNGVLCRESDDAIGVCSRDLLNVRDSLVLINAFSNATSYSLLVIEADEGNEPGGSDPLDDGETYLLYVSDIFNNPPPPGSEITYEGSGRCDVLTPSPTIGDTNRAGAFSVSFAVSTADGEEPSADPDQVSILLTLPNGSITVRTYACRVEEPVPDTPTPEECLFSPQPPGCP